MKPFGKRCIVKINKKYLMQKGKPVLDESGQPVYEQEEEATVLSSNIDGIKKGMKIIPVIRGGVPIRKEETKKYLIVVIEEYDIVATEV